MDGEGQLRKPPAFPNEKNLKILHVTVRVLSSILLPFLNLQNFESVQALFCIIQTAFSSVVWRWGLQ